MNLQTFIDKVFESRIPENYEITKVDLSVCAGDTPEGGKIFFRGGSESAKITLEKTNAQRTDKKPKKAKTEKE